MFKRVYMLCLQADTELLRAKECVKNMSNRLRRFFNRLRSDFKFWPFGEIKSPV